MRGPCTPRAQNVVQDTRTYNDKAQDQEVRRHVLSINDHRCPATAPCDPAVHAPVVHPLAGQEAYAAKGGRINGQYAVERHPQTLTTAASSVVGDLGLLELLDEVVAHLWVHGGQRGAHLGEVHVGEIHHLVDLGVGQLRTRTRRILVRGCGGMDGRRQTAEVGRGGGRG